MIEPAPQLDRLISCRTQAIRYLFIPKCGCTFVKNLLWRVDSGKNYVDPPRIHDAMEEFTRASELRLSVEEVRVEEHCFVVLRNPVDRFLSLYLDKVVGNGYLRFVPLRTTLQNYGLNVDASGSAEHARNCMIMIEWIETNLTAQNELPRDAHWSHQHWRGSTIKGFDMKMLTVSNLDAQLRLLLADLVPDVGSILGGLERYATNSRNRKDAILDSSIRRRINNVYKRDRELYERLREVWHKVDPKTNREIPRASVVF